LNRIYIKLIGKIGSSGRHEIKTLTGLWAGSVSFLVSDSGFVLALGLVDDDWFCSKIIVTTPEGVSMLFPCHRWMNSNKRLSLRDAVGSSKSHVLCMHVSYRWGIYAEGLPHIVNAESPTVLPPEVRFSFTKKKEFLFTLVIALFNIFMPVLTEYVEKNWMRDDFFGYQFLNGLNPTMIKRCSELPENFPVTNDMVKSSLPEKSTLEMEIELKRGRNIFLCDYKRLNGLQGNEINKKKQYLSAPLCLLFSTPENKLTPIAIQNISDPSRNPIFLPSENEKDWLLAKIFVRGAEFNEHELNFHLLRTHLLGEVFTMAVMRNLPSCHPLFKAVALRNHTVSLR
uniref:Lipoxygenase domain-containing protein n=1 Tax=Astyanax mexicanus TaxID=7994 RepID=W5K0Z1_ASTMX